MIVRRLFSAIAALGLAGTCCAMATEQGTQASSQILMKVRVTPNSSSTEDTPVDGSVLNATHPAKGPFRRFDIDYAALAGDMAFGTQPDGKHTGELEFRADVYDAAGTLMVTTGRNVKLNITSEQYQQLIAHGVNFHMQISVPTSGGSLLRIALHDLNSKKSGVVEVSASTVAAVEVNDLAQTASAPATPPETKEAPDARSRSVANAASSSIAAAAIPAPAPRAQRADPPDLRGVGRPMPAVLASVPNGRYYALVIGIDKYAAPMHPLKTAVHDADAIAADLTNLYGFQVTLLKDGQATHDAILTAITQYQETLNDSDSLLIYYAGHGYAVKNSDGKTYDKAYWLPADANSSSSPHRIIADDLTSDIREIRARHVLVISDSCYAGGLSRESTDKVSPAAQPEFVARMLAGRSRNLMASGGVEPVSDNGPGGHSIFAAAVLQALEHPIAGMFTAQQMFFDEVQPRVAGGADQIPVYSLIKNSGHENGDFVFVKAAK